MVDASRWIENVWNRGTLVAYWHNRRMSVWISKRKNRDRLKKCRILETEVVKMFKMFQTKDVCNNILTVELPLRKMSKYLKQKKPWYDRCMSGEYERLTDNKTTG